LVKGTDHGYLVVNRFGNRINPNGIWAVVKRHAEDNGVKDNGVRFPHLTIQAAVEDYIFSFNRRFLFWGGGWDDIFQTPPTRTMAQHTSYHHSFNPALSP
jgi:hypothetical protein